MNNRKTVSWLTALSLLATGVAASGIHQKVTAASYKEVTASWLTVRNQPSSNGEAVDWLKKSTIVSVLSSKSGWDYVEYENGKKGYVYGQHLKTLVSASPQSTSNQKKVTAHWLTMRTGPGSSYKAIDFLKQGTTVSVLSAKGSWSYIQVNGKKGYVASSYLSADIKTPAPAAPPSPGTNTSYKVKAGDTLWSISRQHNMSIEKLKDINQLRSNVVRVGQTLVVNQGNSVQPPAPSKPAGSLAGKEIVLDPGHGGRFAGAHSFVHEEDVVLQISMKVKKKLENNGAKVIMTRTSDVACTPSGYTYAQDLACRPNIAKKNNSDMFVSIHANAGVQTANGTETWYMNSKRGDYKLAQAIYNEMKATGLKGRGVKQNDWAVLRHSGTNIPSTLVETAFVSNPSDAARLKSSSSQEQIAQAIANGIAQYFK